QEMDFTLVESTEAVGAQRLHDADVDVGVVVLHEDFALDVKKAGQRIEVVVEQLLPQIRGKIRLGVVQERGDIVLQSAFASALVIDKIRLAVAQHDIARLKVAIKEEIARCAQEELREGVEVVFQRLLAERNAG